MVARSSASLGIPDWKTDMKHQDLSSRVPAFLLVLLVLGVSTSGACAPQDPRLQSVEDLVEVGFSRSRVVIMNEAHSGLKSWVRTRQVGLRILFRAHAAGVLHLAMEALDGRFADKATRTRVVPTRSSGYLAQEDMRRLIRAALDLGWTLVPYESDYSKMAALFEDTMSRAATNWREQGQAKNLTAVMDGLGPAARLLVWCGNGHLRKKPLGNWKPMGAQFWELSGIEPLSIDQTLTVVFKKGGLSRGQPLLERFQKQLEATPGETMGFLRENWKDGRDHKGYDAFIISLHNTLE